MSLYKRLIDALLPRAAARKVREVRIGLTYTAVNLENGQTGVAYTFCHDHRRGCALFQGADPLAGRKASDLLPFLESADKIEAAVGLATANALANTRLEGLLQGDITDCVSLLPDDAVGMVGYFAPLVPRLRKAVSSLVIFEQLTEKQEGLLPEEEAFRILPECQVALITSTSILNRTIEGLLEAVRPCREVALLGASTPLVPEAFANTPVTLLSGVVVTDPGEILRIVGQGGGMRLFKNHLVKVNLPLH